MNDPRRLLDEGADDFERALLSAAERDVGSQRAAARCAAAVSAVALATKTAGASSGLSLLPALKAGLVGAALGLVVSGASVVLGSNGPEKSAMSRAPAASAARGRVRGDAPAGLASRALPPRENALEPERLHDDGADRDAGARTPTRSTSTTHSEPAPAQVAPSMQGPDRALEREVFWLDRARQALASNDPRSATAALDSYFREFPRGALQPEADFLRVRALLGAGQRSEADALGRRLLAKHPAAAHARKLRELLGQSQLP